MIKAELKSQIDKIKMEDQIIKDDINEDLQSNKAIADKNWQFRTPSRIIKRISVRL